ncbi:MAG: DNA transformation protein, partial [Gammaproteobacteria bacterium]
DEKQALRIRFDKIKAATFDVERSELETFLNRIGVVEVKP